MSPHDRTYLEHMLETAQKAAAKGLAANRERFELDEDLRLSVAHLIQIIGEAARRVSEETIRGLPEIPWSDIIGMRHKIVHDYFGVDFDIVWEVAHRNLPVLVRQLDKVLSELDPE